MKPLPSCPETYSIDTKLNIVNQKGKPLFNDPKNSWVNVRYDGKSHKVNRIIEGYRAYYGEIGPGQKVALKSPEYHVDNLVLLGNGVEYLTFDGKKFKQYPRNPLVYLSEDAMIISGNNDVIRQLKKGYPDTGYEFCIFKVDKKIKTNLVHRLMWETWRCPIPDGWQIDHCDSNRLNNHISNLKAVSAYDNMGLRDLRLGRLDNYEYEGKIQKYNEFQTFYQSSLGTISDYSGINIDFT